MASANAPAIAAFYDQMSVTRCARVLARDDLLGDAATVEPSYIIALPETEEAVLADADAAGVRTIALGKCLRYCRRIDRARSLCRESFEEMFDWMAGHGYRLRGDVLLVPQFFNLDAHGEDIELLFVPLE